MLSSVADAMDTFDVDAAVHPRPTTLQALAQAVGKLAEAGYLIALDEFQYFSRKPLYEFTSHLQAVVDDLSRRASDVPGGLLVLGSLHVELVALLEDRNAPLYNRTTDHIELDHLDIASLSTLLHEHADDGAGTPALPVEPLRRRPKVLSRLLRTRSAKPGTPRTVASDVLPKQFASTNRSRELVSERAARSLRHRAQVRRSAPRLQPRRTFTAT